MQLTTLKRVIRAAEAQITPLSSTIQFDGRDIQLVRSLWWNEATQPWFDAEIVPYFQPLDGRKRFQRIVDAGGSTGLFALASAIRFPEAKIDVFEPSPRQQTMIRRNASKNSVTERIQVYPLGLWNEPARLAFRTHGSISSLQKVTMMDPAMPFEETVEVVTLDAWAAKEKIEALDLIKMDIEGAEIEALEGAKESLKRFKPDILLQAYHIREGARTLERCIAILEPLRYSWREIPGISGFVYAHGS
jgi:FkbM family methyltransferase